jgi:hypothetical protein
VATNRGRYYPDLGNEVTPVVKIEMKQVRDILYSLRDKVMWDIEEITLTKNILVNPVTYAGKPLLLIIYEDATGGWTPTFHAKFKGIAAIVWDTTPSTYSTLFFYPVKDDVVLLISGVTGLVL